MAREPYSCDGNDGFLDPSRLDHAAPCSSCHAPSEGSLRSACERGIQSFRQTPDNGSKTGSPACRAAEWREAARGAGAVPLKCSRRRARHSASKMRVNALIARQRERAMTAEA
jgi:hypothetical protein